MGDSVGLAVDVLEAGVSALVPGAGFGVAIAKRALQPEIEQLRKWQGSSYAQRELSRAVETWALGRQDRIGEADLDVGMKAAAAILRQKGASVRKVADLNLDPGAIARAVLADDSHPQQNLGSGAQGVCSFAVETFYIRLVGENRDGLDRAIQRVLLIRSDEALRKIEAIWELLQVDDFAKSYGELAALRELFLFLKDKRLMRYGFGQSSGIDNLGDLASRIDAIRSHLLSAIVDAAKFPSLNILQDACQALLTKVYGRISDSHEPSAADIRLDVDELRGAFLGVAQQVYRESGITEANDLAETIREGLPGLQVGGQRSDVE